MDTKQITIPFRTFSQATVYGDDNYGNQVYSCQDGDITCTTPTNTGGETGTGNGSTTVPNTGFLAMSQESALMALGGGLLLLIAVVLAGVFVVSKSRKRKHKTEDL